MRRGCWGKQMRWRGMKNLYSLRLRLVARWPVFVLIAANMISTAADSQVLTVRLLNAKSGKPMGNKKITFLWSDKNWSKSEVLADDEGVGRVDIPSGVSSFSLMEGPRLGNEPNRIAYINCNQHLPVELSVSVVLQRGLIPDNGCGRKSVVARPGEIVFWALPLPWRMSDFQ